MICSSDLQERIGLGMSCLAFFAEVKVRSDTALVPDALDGISITDVTNVVCVDLSLLISSSLSKVINHQSLESLAGISGDLLSEDLEKL